MTRPLTRPLTAPGLLPRVVRALLARDSDAATDLERGHDLAGRLASRRSLPRRRRPTGWDGFRRAQLDYDGCVDPDDG
jgi:hypothetical protein